MSNISEIWGRYRTKKFARTLLILAILLVFTIVMDKLVMPWYVNLGDEVEMPDMVEKEFPDAEKELISMGFQVVLVDSVYDSHYPSGTVVEQMPLPYSTVKKGRHVYVKVSIGEKPIIMPNLFGRSPRDAEFLLKANGLELSSTLYAYSDIYPEGVVIAQTFPQGQKIKKKTRITITVSLGSLPEQRTVPELVGKSLSSAKKQLQHLGVRIDQIEYEERENVLPETILKQSLAPGQPIERETEIVLLVSKLKPIGD
ncbi:MAG: PASTA domain-containing protein [Calditrichaceae bacterium]